MLHFLVKVEFVEHFRNKRKKKEISVVQSLHDDIPFKNVWYGRANIRCFEGLHVKRQNHQEKLVGQVEKGLFEGLLGIKSTRRGGRR